MNSTAVDNDNYQIESSIKLEPDELVDVESHESSIEKTMCSTILTNPSDSIIINSSLIIKSEDTQHNNDASNSSSANAYPPNSVLSSMLNSAIDSIYASLQSRPSEASLKSTLCTALSSVLDAASLEATSNSNTISIANAPLHSPQVSAVRQLLNSVSRASYPNSSVDMPIPNLINRTSSDSLAVSEPKKTHARGQDQPYFCVHCGEKFSAQVQLERHMKIHPGIFLYFCSECEYKTNFKQAFKNHNVFKHASGDLIPFQCPVCNKEFYQAHVLKKHMHIHSEDRPHTCTQCDYSTTTKSNLYSHLKRSHPSAPHPHSCPACNKGFVYLCDLQRHLVIHTGQRLYQCPSCPIKFNRKSNLQKHVERVHLKIDIRRREKLHCCEACDKCFGSNCDLERHISAVHSNERPFACDRCDYKSARKSNLDRHRQCKHGLFDNTSEGSQPTYLEMCSASISIKDAGQSASQLEHSIIKVDNDSEPTSQLQSGHFDICSIEVNPEDAGQSVSQLEHSVEVEDDSGLYSQSANFEMSSTDAGQLVSQSENFEKFSIGVGDTSN